MSEETSRPAPSLEAFAVEPPAWQTGRPSEPGVYVGFSALAGRNPGIDGLEVPDVYIWTGEAFQHHVGWYDNAITHWMKLDIPLDPAQAAPRDGS